MEVKHNGQSLFIKDEKIDAQVLNLYNNLKVIGCPMTGLDHIDLEECKKRGIKVISLQGETEFLKDVTSTAEHTIGLMIALMRNYKTALNAPYKHRDQYMGHRLSGKKLLLIGGEGRVGSQVREIAEGLRMKVYTIDIAFKENRFLLWLGKKLGFDENNLFIYTALSQADIVSIHIPLAGNEGFFTREMFEQMKNTVYFINTSRSKILAEGALIQALEQGFIAGAAVDFIDDPNLKQYAATHNNLVLTPHLGGVTIEDRKKTDQFIQEKVEKYVKENLQEML